MSERFLSSPPAKTPRGCLSNIYYKNLVEFLELNLTILWGVPCEWAPLDFFKLSGLSTLSLNLLVKVQVFLHWPWLLSRFPLVSFYSAKWGLHVFAWLSLQSCGQKLALCPLLSCGSQKSCWFFSVYLSFLLLLWWIVTSKIVTCRMRNDKSWRIAEVKPMNHRG